MTKDLTAPVATQLTQEQTPYCFIKHIAERAPNRPALIHVDDFSSWKVKDGRLLKGNVDTADWKTVTYKQFYEKVEALREILPYNKRIVILFLAKTRADLLSLIIALQANSNTILLGALSKEFGGIRKYIRSLSSPDAIICSKPLYRLFHLFGTGILEKKLERIDAKLVLKAADGECKRGSPTNAIMNEPSLDHPCAVMHTTGTTGARQPIDITLNMLAFQANNYKNAISGLKGNYVSCHMSINFVLLDLCCGGTAVLQPMGLTESNKTVDAEVLPKIFKKFQCQVTSAPPALWDRILRTSGDLSCLKVAFLGGAESPVSLCKSLLPRLGDDAVFSRVYGATQSLPIAAATANEIIQDESVTHRAAIGGGVYFGKAAGKLEAYIDKDSWKAHGGLETLQLPGRSVELGELCVRGQSVSPSCHGLFRTGDVCYIEDDVIYFLGRKSESVAIGNKLIPPVGLEMIFAETGAIARCAVVGKKDSVTVVAQRHGSDSDKRDRAVCETLRSAFEKSVYRNFVQEISVVFYSKPWPVDFRHSSKTNRKLLSQWVAKARPSTFQLLV